MIGAKRGTSIRLGVSTGVFGSSSHRPGSARGGEAMDFQCDYCGYADTFGLAMAPRDVLCPKCGIGHMREGVHRSGFRLQNSSIVRITGPGEVIPQPYMPYRQGGATSEIHLDFFANEGGTRY